MLSRHDDGLGRATSRGGAALRPLGGMQLHDAPRVRIHRDPGPREGPSQRDLPKCECPGFPDRLGRQPDVYDLWRRCASNASRPASAATSSPSPTTRTSATATCSRSRDGPAPRSAARPRRLARDIERLAEITQIKGDSECRNGFAGDRRDRTNSATTRNGAAPRSRIAATDGTGYGALMDQGCVSRKDYVRYALLEGLREEGAIGVNPFKLGIVGARMHTTRTRATSKSTPIRAGVGLPTHTRDGSTPATVRSTPRIRWPPIPGESPASGPRRIRGTRSSMR